MGFLSGGHCLGMCGPLVLALPVSPGALWISVVYRVIYNAGRITTYGLLGILTGVIGLAFSLQNMQAFLARLAGFFSDCCGPGAAGTHAPFSCFFGNT